MKREGQCPECQGWFEVEWQDDLPPGGWWWKGRGSCPGCDHPIAVESECEFRDVPETIDEAVRVIAELKGLHEGSVASYREAAARAQATRFEADRLVQRVYDLEMRLRRVGDRARAYLRERDQLRRDLADVLGNPSVGETSRCECGHLKVKGWRCGGCDQ